ncbi:glycosyltransferase family 4 protein [Pyxidicoccus xibeiensis]|uniref:glycosyltransferase family 4 protein n=1 Tax=Pyxidicoccus xibeiensis TaxID=2906759 RepID=UPI0020A706E5|nr:glycosyltransferase family 4 protein [Pyxidicoccus xibeiensis]MCP3144173.1 glycosyltransferase family 4 protein [Pyxidicoccus xibeiensis]
MPPSLTAPAWHVLTGEYPPQPGGVSDYTRQVALALAHAGREVHVWAPGDAGVRTEDGVTVHRIPGLFTPAGLVRLTRGLDGCPAPRRLLLQYVPHAFGMKAMNVPFCAWFAARRRDERWVFFHEVVYPWSPRAPLRHQVLAGTTRVMLRLVAGAADRVFVSIPAWAEHLPSRVRGLAEWRPVPSTLPSEVTGSAVEAVRSTLGPGPWLGHFGTYGALTAGPLEAVLVPLLRTGGERRALLLGRGSRAFAEGLGARHPEVAGRVVTRDSLASEDVAAHLAACDVLVQPYPDGVSARRTTTMAGLALGRPLVTNTGHLTEPMWRELGAVALVEGTSPGPLVEATERLLADAGARSALGERAAQVYRERFALERTVETLLRPGPMKGSSR